MQKTIRNAKITDENNICGFDRFYGSLKAFVYFATESTAK